MDVYWFEQTQATVPSDDHWLSANEARFLRGMRFPRRRADWMLGRWTAKNALAICLGLSVEPSALREIEIRAAASGAPEAFLGNRPAAVTLSLSHRDGFAACALAPSRVALGCDLETVEPRSEAFAGDYFATEEQSLVANASAANRDGLLALLWSSKESALKALRVGLRRDTRTVIVSFSCTPMIQIPLEEFSERQPFPADRFSSEARTWSQLQVHTTDGQSFSGWWMESGGLLRTLVTVVALNPPVLVSPGCSLAV